MRVLHIGKYFPPQPGGIEYVLRDLMASQLRIGVEPGAMVHHHDAGQATREEDFRGAPVWRVRTFGSLVYAPVAPTFPLVMRRVVKRFKPDVIHYHMPNTSALWSLVGAACGTPGVVQWHSDVTPSKIDRRLRLAYGLYRPFEQWLLRKARVVAATSPPYLASSEPLSRWQAKGRVIPLGIDPDRLPEPAADVREEAQQRWRPGLTRVLAIGRLTYYKGFRYLLEAMAKTPAAQLVIVGRGGLEANIRKRIDELDLADRVTLCGEASDDQVRGLLATCDLLCMSSIERTEAFGVVLMEAMRYGKPLAACDIPGSGVGWVVRHDVNGLLAPIQDSDALAATLQRLVDDEALRHRLGAAGKLRFDTELHMDRVAEAWRQAYEDALA